MMNRIKKLLFSIILLMTVSNVEAKIRVVSTLPNFSAIAKEIGGDKIEVTTIAKGYQNPHFIDPKPSFIIKMKKTDILVWAGLDLEIYWLTPLLENSRNSNIMWGAPGNVDASKGVSLLEIPNIPAAQLRAGGDIHVYGNPHYWHDPQNGKIIARNIYDAFVNASPKDAEYFKRNLEDFNSRLDTSIKKWLKLMEPFKGWKIIAYHNSWPYLEDRFGFVIVDFVEPKPGIPPSPNHLVKLIKKMRNQNIKIIIISPYFSDKPAKVLADKVGGQVVLVAPSVGAFEGVDSYFDLFDYNLGSLVDAFKSMDSKN
ncbi:MAG: zinc ABC transporter substrate-binding protein [Candidatus Marinimicrobia bacterium]|nr:zinc ABC transporter substrate-binding protein [Candidatus Neomarinimicrobiota bacterium]